MKHVSQPMTMTFIAEYDMVKPPDDIREADILILIIKKDRQAKSIRE